MNMQMILFPIGAAALGYFTNLLAIAMLFRPHEPKYVFRLRLPFTPGLIPKERHLLAKKIGLTFKGKVLTDEVLEEMLANPSMLERLDALVADLAARVFNNQQTIEELLGSEKIDEIIILVEQYLTENTERLLDDERTLAEALPYDLAERLSALPSQHVDKLAPIVDKVLNIPQVNESGRALIAKIAKDHIGGLVGMFVNPDKIFESIRAGIIDYFNEPDNLDALAQIVSEYSERIMDWRVCDVGQKIASLPLEGLMTTVKKPSDKLFAKILRTPISDILAKIPDDTKNKSIEQIAALVRKAVAVAVPKIIASVDIAQVIEDKINTFETREMERILLDVVRKQLGMIAMLGGVLGFIIGLIPVLIQM